MKKNKAIRYPLAVAGLSALLLGACGPSPRPNQPSPLNTPADMWAELENVKGEVRRLNAKVEELNQQAQQNKVDPELGNKVARLEGNVSRMASQLSIDLGNGPAGQAAQAPQAAPAQQPQYGAQAQPQYAAPAAQGQYGAAQPQYQQAPQAQPQYDQQSAYGAQENQTGYANDGNGAAATTVSPNQPLYQQPPAVATPATPTPQQAAAQNPADVLYAKGLASFNASQYQQSLGIFQEFTRNFKNSPLMANALFWTGESYFQLGDFANAALSYQEVIEKYPKSAKTPDSLFKRGVAFMKLGNPGAAKLSFKEVIDKYPNSAFAARAKSMMPK